MDKAVLPIQAEPVSRSKRVRFLQLDGLIRRGRETFLEVAVAMMEVRERKLYKLADERFCSFAAYAHSRGISRIHAYRLSRAGRVIKECQENGLAPPATERSARAMWNPASRVTWNSGNGAAQRKAEPESRIGIHDKLIVVAVYQVQRLAMTDNGLERYRISDHPTEQEAEAELRRLQAKAETAGRM